MNKTLAPFALLRLGLVMIILLAAPAAFAVEIAGRVTNATTGQPVPGQSVNLLALRGQMVPVRETQTDDQGRYRFVVAANPSERFLVQVPFHGVTYNVPAAFTTGERITADVTVYDTGAAPADISIQAQTIFLDPHSDHLRVTEFYSVANRSQPPRAYDPEGGSFHFALAVPGGAPTGAVGDLQVTATRAAGMPLRQQPQPAERPNTFAVNFALHPGDTEFQVSYVFPKSGNTIDLSLPLLAATPRRHLAVPKEGVKVQGAGLREIVQSQAPQVRVYAVETQAPGELRLRIEVDPAALAAASPAPSAPEASEGESQVSIVPHPVNRAQWYIVGLSLFVLLLGLYYLSSFNLPTPAGPAPRATNEPVRQPERRTRQ